ncbi:hypothetical protein DOTSEDRAFT_68685 [Dothistroma septosporum NZE10]|uniref:Uncharacterized protein n=1 Tax=Dothistroma septosporum (strain NZE10 / CBS 128990) TaxID=675120 RepID=N1Q4W2_DOTSN|nr:hypothetical protein DOTSEDRAFT_68685 [Dothistroma septosporum NZE10]
MPTPHVDTLQHRNDGMVTMIMQTRASISDTPARALATHSFRCARNVVHAHTIWPEGRDQGNSMWRAVASTREHISCCILRTRA